MDEHIFLLKKKIRKEICELKEKISAEEKNYRSKKLFEKIENLGAFKEAQTIMLYWSLPDEVQTHEFILKWANEKRFVLPVVTNTGLEIRLFDGIENLVASGKFNIFEPQGSQFSDDIDLIIVPGLAFDKNNNRIGRGKAYYDNILPHLSALKIGVCFDFQLLDQVPVSAHDVKVDMVVTG